MHPENENRQTQHMNSSPSAFSCPFPPEGCDFGRYRNMTVIGEGGMGRVFKAFDPMLELDLAVKVIPRGVHASEEERKRFMREIRLLAGLTIPGVVRLFDCGECDGWQYYTMELLEGKTLDRYIRENELGLEESLGYIQKLGVILQSIHEQGIIHRDLKPSNVIITDDGDIRLTDFGIAKQYVEDREDTGITMLNSRPGTPYYMSPDPSAVLRDLAKAKKADVYSLAVMAYELVTGRFPYDIENLTATECILVIREEPPYSFKDRDVAIPLDIEILIMSALDKDPLKRPDAGDFAERLGVLLASSEETASSKTGGRPVLNWIAAAAAVILVVIGVHLWLMKQRQAGQLDGGQGGNIASVPSGSDSQVAGLIVNGGDTGIGTDSETVASITYPVDDGDASGNTGDGNVADTGDGNVADTGQSTIPEDENKAEKMFAAALAQAEGYLESAKWSEAETAFLSLQKIPGYEACKETPEGVRLAKRGRLMEAAVAASAIKDWETVKAMTGEVLTLMPGDADALALNKQAVEATQPVLTVTVMSKGQLVKGAAIYLDRVLVEGNSAKVERQGKHTIRVVAPRDKDTVYLPYRADFYMADRPLEMKVILESLNTLVGNDINMEMVPIAAGEFQMGGATDIRDQNGSHVTLTRHFWMSRYEVNQDQYYIIQRSNPSSIRGERYPVTKVTWADAMAFCDKLTKREKKAGRLPDGYVYRLPTEAEWEYVCKAGTGLSQVVPANDSAGKAVNCALSGLRQHTDVGYGQPNAWGIYNMLGNVREWAWDGYSGFVNPSPVNPFTAQIGHARVVRGGSWKSRIVDCTSLSRDRSASSNKGYSDVGFRIVLAAPL